MKNLCFFIYAFIYYVWIFALLKLSVPFDKLVILITPVMRFNSIINPDELHRKLHKFIYTTVFSKHIFLPTCLRWSLLLYHFLALFKFKPVLNIGAAREGENRLNCHAWVNCSGVPVEENISAYKILWTFPNP